MKVGVRVGGKVTVGVVSRLAVVNGMGVVNPASEVVGITMVEGETGLHPLVNAVMKIKNDISVLFTLAPMVRSAT
jgi:hypothetical protein